MMLAILAALYAGALIFDFRPNMKGSAKGERALYLGLLVVSFSLLALNELGVRVPSPAVPIKQAVEALFHIQ